jgi:putative molybdopterin biosynthesis protein
MERRSLHKEIVESVRRQLLSGLLMPGDALPTVREMAENWGCAPGTVQTAYRELAEQGLIEGRPGRGTHVRMSLAEAAGGSDTPMRRAMLVHDTETFLLDALTAGYTPDEVAFALHAALDRWRAILGAPNLAPERVWRFVGSHDPAVSYIASRYAEIELRTAMTVKFVGSLGGLEALAKGEADIAGCHLWDPETEQYNVPYVQRLLPGRKIALIRVADRHLGLVTAAGNPKRIQTLADLTRSDVRFVNRQPGSGTRVWLDARLDALGISGGDIRSYDVEVTTHGEVAQKIAEGRADAGLAIATVAHNYELGFVSLTWEPYDLVVTADKWDSTDVRGLLTWLRLPGTKNAIHRLGGYRTTQTGSWVKLET